MMRLTMPPTIIIKKWKKKIDKATFRKQLKATKKKKILRSKNLRGCISRSDRGA